MDTGRLRVDQTYIFRLAVGAAGKDTVYAAQFLTVEEGNPTQVSVVCAKNCAPFIDADEKLSVEARCENCQAAEKVTYVWSLYPSLVSARKFDFRRDTMTGNGRKQLVVKPNVFNPLEQVAYMFDVIG